MMAETGKIGEISQLRRQSLQDDTVELVLFQLEGRTYWVVPARPSNAQQADREQPPSIGSGRRSICGWLRADDRNYFVVTQTDDVKGQPYSVLKDAPWEMLSERETQIAHLVSHGKGTKQIAGHLLISEHTVRSYMRRIFSKLHVSTRPAMVAELMRLGFIAPDFGGPRPKGKAGGRDRG